MNEFNLKRRFGTCSKDCYGSCVFLGLWDDTAKVHKFVKALPSKNHPFTKGFFCEKFSNRETLFYHPQRLKSALVRVGPKGTNKFKSIELEEAINKISQLVFEIKERYGPESIIGSYYAGNFGLISKLGPLRFFNKLGATITTGGICNEAGSSALEKMFGVPSLTNPLQMLKAKLIVVWGSNLPERNVHAYGLLKQAKKNGTKLVVVDTRKHLLGEEADLFIQPYPGMEFLLAKILINHILKSESQDFDFILNNLDNAQETLENLRNVDVNSALKQCGLKMDDILLLGELLQKYKHETIFNIGFGIQKYFHGGLTIQLIALIQVILGNLGKPGTGVIYDQGGFSDFFMNSIKKNIIKFKNSSLKSQIKLIDLGWALNSLKYKLLFIYNFNPASSLPNQNLVRHSLQREDLITVVLDPFLTETTKYADFVIPSKFGVENDDIYDPYYIPGVSINQAGPCPYPNCLTNYEFFQKIAFNLGWDKFFQESQEEILTSCINILPENVKENVISQGFHVLFGNDDVPFEERFSKPSNNKIIITSKSITENPLIHQIEKDNEFYLISPSHKNYIHSQFSQIQPKTLDDFEKVFLSSTDMNRLNLEKNELVLVSNRYGKAKYKVDLNDGLRSKVALIFSGSPSLTLSEVNVNIFTPQDPEESRLSGSYNSAVIEISKL